MKMRFDFSSAFFFVGLSSIFTAAQGVAQPVTQDGVEFTGYWRAGFNTAPNLVNRPDDADGQGGIDAPVSRHIHNPNYFRLTLARKFSTGLRVEAGLDSPDEKNIPHGNGVWKSDSVRVRDLFVEMPLDESTKLWAGSRRFEYEDVRLLDFFPFGLNAFGAGVDASWGAVALSAQDEAFDSKTLDKQSKRKNLTAMIRGVIKIDETSSLKPTFMFTVRGKDPAHKISDPNFSSVQADASTATAATKTVAEKKANNDVKAGVVYSYSGADHWAYNFLVVASESGVNADGDVERDMHYSLCQSGSFGLTNDASILTALSIDSWNYKSERPTFKIENSLLVPDDKTKTKSTLSIGVQPVYFVTEKFHVSLDLNVVNHFKKTAANQANAIFVTPIVRYAMNKNALGTPQIYTSMTYGSYDAKIKAKFDSEEMQNRLVTSQTGFEVWF